MARRRKVTQHCTICGKKITNRLAAWWELHVVHKTRREGKYWILDETWEICSGLVMINGILIVGIVGMVLGWW